MGARVLSYSVISFIRDFVIQDYFVSRPVKKELVSICLYEILSMTTYLTYLVVPYFL
jgi:hypothetical protein